VKAFWRGHKGELLMDFEDEVGFDAHPLEAAKVETLARSGCCTP